MPERCPPLRCVASVSGIRGVIGDDLAPDQVLALAAAFGVAIAGRGPVVLGRDSRPTGALLAAAASAGLAGVGCEVIDLGIVPTPTVALAVRHHRAAGGVQISASHNPVEWNALKCFTGEGRNIAQDQLDWILNAYADPPIGQWSRWDAVGAIRQDDQAIRRHLDAVIAAVDADAIRRARLAVAIDCVNGAGARSGPELLRRLGCRVTVIDGREDQPFPRDPEPTSANTARTAAMVAASGACIGFVQDPDADRLAVIAGDGRYLGEESTLALCADARLAQERAAGRSGTVVTNLSTSRMVDVLALRHGGRVVRTKVGEAHVVAGLLAERAALAGEGNGGVIDPRVVVCRDSHIAMALILERLAAVGGDLATLLAALPPAVMVKAKVELDRADLPRVLAEATAAPLATGAAVDRQDGLKLSWDDRWVSLRASGTEPVGRIIAEAPDRAAAEAMVAAVAAAGHLTLIESH